MLPFSHTTPGTRGLHREPEPKGHAELPVPPDGRPLGTPQLPAVSPQLTLPAHSYLPQPLPGLPIPSLPSLPAPRRSPPLLPHFPRPPLLPPLRSIPQQLRSANSASPRSRRLPAGPRPPGAAPALRPDLRAAPSPVSPPAAPRSPPPGRSRISHPPSAGLRADHSPAAARRPTTPAPRPRAHYRPRRGCLLPRWSPPPPPPPP